MVGTRLFGRRSKRTALGECLLRRRHFSSGDGAIIISLAAGTLPVPVGSDISTQRNYG